MSIEKKQEIVPFEQTCLVRINAEESTLPLDTAAELSKGLMWVNSLIGEVLDQRYITEVEDNNGMRHNITKFHPLTMKLLDEQRKRIDQIYRILGGEEKNEVAKELNKLTAKMIFEASKRVQSKRDQKENAIEIIEADMHDKN